MIERIIVVKMHFTVYKKENKQRKRKQAYAMVDLDLDERLSMGGTLSESDHELIGQVGARSVGGIRKGATGLIMSNHCFSRFRLSIPNL